MAKVLTYHEIQDSNEFETQMRFVGKRDNVLVTFDDGHRSVLDNALPILQKYKIKSIAFVNPGLLGQGSRVTLDEIKKLHDGGVIIANHGWSHKPLAGLSLDEVKSEYEKARDWIRQNIHVNAEPETFALPRGSEDADTRTILKNLGAKKIFGSERIDVYPGRSLRYFKWSLNSVFQFLRRGKISILYSSNN